MDLILTLAAVCGVAGLLLLVRSRSAAPVAVYAVTVLGFSTGVVNGIVPVRLVLIPILVFAIFTLGASAPVRIVTLLIAAAAILLQFTGVDRVDAERITRMLCAFPLAFLVGYSMAEDTIASFRRAVAGSAIVCSAAATYEYVHDAWIFSRPDLPDVLFRSGHIRAVIAAEHPLVLGVMLAASTPLVLGLRLSLGVRLALTTLVGFGVFATNSRGALALFFIAVLFHLAMNQRWARLFASLTARLVAVALAATTLWLLTHRSGSLGSIASGDLSVASAEYRALLYRAGATALHERPTGWGLGGLPHGVFYVASPFGNLDIANTVDSEIVLMIFSFGYVGLLLYILAAWRSVRRLGLRNDVNRATLLFIVAGTFVALHAWIGLGTVLMMLLGACRSDATVRLRRESSAGAPSLARDDERAFDGSDSVKQAAET